MENHVAARKKNLLLNNDKMLQKANRDKSLSSNRSKGKAGGAKSVRNPVLMKVAL